MKFKLTTATGLIIVCTTVLHAQQVTIGSLDGNGQLTVNAPSNSDFTVEWASSLSPASEWQKSWIDLKNIQCTNGTITVDVPMFYRVTCWTNGLFIRLPVGRTLTFSVTNDIDESWTQEASFAASATFPAMSNDYQLIIVSDHWDGEKPSGADDESNGLFIRSDDSRMYLFYHMNMQENAGWRIGEIGTTWTNIDEYGERVETSIEAYENVTVPAGSFDGCIKFHNRSLDASYQWDEWVKPGFFMVKWIDGGTTVYELQSWRDE